MYPLRAVLTTLWFFGFSLLFLPVVIFRPFNPNNSGLYCRMLSFVGLKIMGVRYVRRNFEQLTRAQPCIFLVNHQSLIDVFMVGNLVPDRTVSVGKKSLLWMPLFGWIFWLSGNLFIDRSNRERAMATMKKAEDLIKEKGLSVLIAPEGTRSKTLGVFKKGAFHLAQATGLNLQPIAISSFDQGLNYWHWNAGSVIVEVLKPISVKGKTIEALMEESHEMIRVALERINKEIAPAYS